MRTALHREDHFDHEKHMAAVPHLEKAWKNNNKDAEHDALCQYPRMILEDHSRNLWNGNLDLTEAITDATNYSEQYESEAQFNVKG